VERSGTPYFCFKDIDENKPSGSIKIRVETIGYFLKRYREDMVRQKQKQLSIDEQLQEFEQRLRHELRLAASLGAKSGGCGSADEHAPAELISIAPAPAPEADLVQLAGD
jgi:hypothetical protein